MGDSELPNRERAEQPKVRAQFRLEFKRQLLKRAKSEVRWASSVSKRPTQFPSCEPDLEVSTSSRSGGFDHQCTEMKILARLAMHSHRHAAIGCPTVDLGGRRARVQFSQGKFNPHNGIMETTSQAG
ncbi:hypothetical protein FA13DRAFT_1716932 [Coprinellus micaceus]|uniref:Uncharacterized protein n=1 Tax=Coprinellus micaceus TaxID=71717 RepID=A0A4Y7SHM8_COPMI|nr:hypothetical protein FA13DRAFT_1716932 [Coprinellus micaceus]